GEYTLAGATQDTENAYTLGFNLHLNNGLGVEYRPVWVNGQTIKLTEHEVSAFYGKRFVAAKAGYHWIISEHDSLKGPFVGISFSF
ncbi:MAG TPA: hypothetical protein VFM46_01830, partial [Pseudomonadales bacterium]|nr:hypothetical protein [Pseudomonadales bacterium]